MLMGLFDKMFGDGATAARQQPDSERRFDELKLKYGSALNVLDQQGIQVLNLHVEDNKLLIRGLAPSQDAINRVWDQIKLAEPNPGDIAVDLKVDPSRVQQAQGAATQSYTVKPGDTLSKISKQFYGDANEYMRIFYANRDKLSDPDKIQAGQSLNIPADTDA